MNDTDWVEAAARCLCIYYIIRCVNMIGMCEIVEAMLTIVVLSMSMQEEVGVSNNISTSYISDFLSFSCPTQPLKSAMSYKQKHQPYVSIYLRIPLSIEMLVLGFLSVEIVASPSN